MDKIQLFLQLTLIRKVQNNLSATLRNYEQHFNIEIKCSAYGLDSNLFLPNSWGKPECLFMMLHRRLKTKMQHSGRCIFVQKCIYGLISDTHYFKLWHPQKVVLLPGGCFNVCFFWQIDQKDQRDLIINIYEQLKRQLNYAMCILN